MHPLGRRHLLSPRRQPGNAPLVPALRMSGAPGEHDSTPGLRDETLARVEAALWLTDEPLPLKRLATLADLEAAAATQAIEQLRNQYEADGSAFQIEEVAGGFQLLTRPEFYPWLARLRRVSDEPKLTPALLETLAVIAYRQPLTRADLEAIRGVRSDDALKALLDRHLIEITGRHDSLGRPALYGTTKKFLQSFGLKDLSDLPAAEKTSK
ncbi:MAG: SMC-Scp complex subunit ScpB [Gemmataceae bacterium]